MAVAATRMDTIVDYCEHFGLQRMPFGDSVNPEFFYRTSSHEAAFVRMMMCITQRKTIGLVWGRSGTGKTLISQMLLSALSDTEYVPVVILGHPGMSKMGLLGCVLDELGISRSPKKDTTQTCLGRIHSSLMDSYSSGQRVVMLVDEAHFLPSDQLHMIRALTNLETPHEKLCTIILFAEETFPRRLRHKRYSSLRTRVSMTSYLMPMSESETEQYIKFRLMVAGSTQELFDKECYELLYSHSDGICRQVNKLADLSLLEAFLRGESRVAPDIVRRCINESI